MSKYFNETIRARNATLAGTSIKDAIIEGYKEAAAVPKSAPMAVRSELLPESRNLALPITGILESQFSGSDVLESVHEAYRALRTRLLRLRSANSIQSVVVTSASQGEGKTLTSLNLAVCCAQLHEMKVLLVDADIRSRGLSRALGSPSGYGLAEALSGQCTPEQAISGTELPNLFVMSSGHTSASPAELLASTRWPALVGWSREKFKIVIVDSPPVLDLSDVELLSAACDGIIMVVRAQRTKREILQKSAKQVDPKKLLGVVFNAAEGAHHRYNYASPEAKEG